MNATQIDDLCESLSSPTARVRYGAAKALRGVAAQAPEALYPRFDFFARMLDGDNRIFRWNASRILGSLAAADREDKIGKLFDHFFAPILGHELITAANVIQAAADIAEAKPELADRIAGEVMKVKRANYATPECRNVAIGHALTSLRRMYPHLGNKKPVLAFVRAQVDNPRPAARKRAAEFLACVERTRG